MRIRINLRPTINLTTCGSVLRKKITEDERKKVSTNKRKDSQLFLSVVPEYWEPSDQLTKLERPEI